MVHPTNLFSKVLNHANRRKHCTGTAYQWRRPSHVEMVVEVVSAEEVEAVEVEVARAIQVPDPKAEVFERLKPQ